MHRRHEAALSLDSELFAGKDITELELFSHQNTTRKKKSQIQPPDKADPSPPVAPAECPKVYADVGVNPVATTEVMPSHASEDDHIEDAAISSLNTLEIVPTSSQATPTTGCSSEAVPTNDVNPLLDGVLTASSPRMNNISTEVEDAAKTSSEGIATTVQADTSSIVVPTGLESITLEKINDSGSAYLPTPNRTPSPVLAMHTGFTCDGCGV
jgi:hypothetical protein